MVYLLFPGPFTLFQSIYDYYSWLFLLQGICGIFDQRNGFFRYWRLTDDWTTHLVTHYPHLETWCPPARSPHSGIKRRNMTAPMTNCGETKTYGVGFNGLRPTGDCRYGTRANGPTSPVRSRGRNYLTTAGHHAIKGGKLSPPLMTPKRTTSYRRSF
jgi:hypothetical protein